MSPCWQGNKKIRKLEDGLGGDNNVDVDNDGQRECHNVCKVIRKYANAFSIKMLYISAVAC